MNRDCLARSILRLYASGMRGFLFRCYDCDYWLARVQVVCPCCKRRYAGSPAKPPFKRSIIAHKCNETGPCLTCILDGVEVIDWEFIFEDMEMEDCLDALWHQFHVVYELMAYRPDDRAFPKMNVACGRVIQGVKALKKLHPFNCFELDAEIQKLHDTIDELEAHFQGG